VTISSDAETGAALPLLRVERGQPTAEETAALTVVFLAMLGSAAQPQPSAQQQANSARWHRLERTVAFRPCHSWQFTEFTGRRAESTCVKS
jgi:hypothetical protein